MFDVIIIGGGVAGLYSAYKIKKINPSKKILLLEANNRLGGRAGNVNFNGESIPIGAGVGRKNKDKLLLSLLKELDIQYNDFIASSQYSSSMEPVCKVKEMFLYLKSEYDKSRDKSKTFKQYAKPKLDEKYYRDAYEYFTICAGYTDYENESAYDTLYHYGFDDNYSNWPGFGFSWNMLIEKMVSVIGSINIRMSCYVNDITPLPEKEYCIVCKNKQQFICEKVIIATEIIGLLRLLPNYNIYNQIKGQNFLRIYGKFTDKSNEIMKEKCSKTTIVPGPLHKIIPMNKDKGIYMIAYTDNSGAKILEKYKNNTVKNREIICRLLEIALEIPENLLELEDMIDFYWDVGTHYYKPIRGNFINREDFCYKAQRPMNNVFVVGELVSMKQGWVEGAFESVEDIAKELHR